MGLVCPFLGSEERMEGVTPVASVLHREPRTSARVLAAELVVRVTGDEALGK